MRPRCINACRVIGVLRNDLQPIHATTPERGGGKSTHEIHLAMQHHQTRGQHHWNLQCSSYCACGLGSNDAELLATSLINDSNKSTSCHTINHGVIPLISYPIGILTYAECFAANVALDLSRTSASKFSKSSGNLKMCSAVQFRVASFLPGSSQIKVLSRKVRATNLRTCPD